MTEEQHVIRCLRCGTEVGLVIGGFPKSELDREVTTLCHRCEDVDIEPEDDDRA